MDKYPEAKLIVHESGTRFLTDPSGLKESVERATGESFKYFGDIKPISRDSIMPVSGGEEFDLGNGYSLEVVYSPGHAPHHVCYYEPQSQSLAVGDTAGIYYPLDDSLLASTPPPNFDLERSIETLEDLKELDLEYLFYSHAGWSGSPYKMLNKYQRELQAWVDEIRKALETFENEEKVVNHIKNKYQEFIETHFEDSKERGFSMLDLTTRGVLLYLEQSEKEN